MEAGLGRREREEARKHFKYPPKAQQEGVTLQLDEQWSEAKQEL